MNSDVARDDDSGMEWHVVSSVRAQAFLSKHNKIPGIDRVSNNKPFQTNLKEGYGGGVKIYEDGCLDTLEGWFNKNLYYVGGAALGVAIVQVCLSLTNKSISRLTKTQLKTKPMTFDRLLSF